MSTAIIIICGILICIMFLILSAVSMLDTLNYNLHNIMSELCELSDKLNEQRSDKENDKS